MPKVYAPIDPLRRNRDTGELESVNDYTSAQEFGDGPIFLLGSNAKPEDPNVIEDLWAGLKDFQPDDFFICVGNPIIMSSAFAICADMVGTVNCLQWSYGKYKLIKSEIYSDATY